MRVLKAARSELGRSADQQASALDAVATERAIGAAIDKVTEDRKEQLTDVERADLIVHLRVDLTGWGVLQPLIDDSRVTDIHVYDHSTVVLQRGKVSESTGLHWPSKEAYLAFVDRLLLKLGKSLSTQQHTVDGAFENGIRVCAVHESVCVGCGPLLSIRVPRLSDTSLDMLAEFELAPRVIIEYLASLTRWGHATMLIAGETGTGKTTLLKGLGTQFDPTESIVTVEDTPELNFNHSFLRALVSRPPNVEGIGEVTLQEHIKTTLRMTPNRVILGEMRTPLAAEAFLESAQTGHTGMSTIHARNAKETLVRLESLLGRAQKSVSIDIIRQQIALAVDVIVWMFRDKHSGRPRIGEIIEVGHYVEGSIQIKPIFRFDHSSEVPAWLVESWNSYFEDVLSKDGVHLGRLDKTLHADTAQTRTTSSGAYPRGGVA
jgi:pilus assembly protein CpaF